MQESRGTLILTLGIVASVFNLGGCCPIGFLVGIPAWYMGRGDLKKIQRGEMDGGDQGLVKAGMIMGLVSVFIGVIIGAIFLFFGVFAAMLAMLGIAAG